MGKKFRIKLQRMQGASKSLPSNMVDVVIADSEADAQNIAENRNPGYEADRYGIAQFLGTTLKLGAAIILALLIVKYRDASNGSDRTDAPGEQPSISEQTDAGATEQVPRTQGVLGLDPTQLSPSNVTKEASPEARNSSQATPVVAGGKQARIVDSREEIVLQSGPKMSSRNVAKIDTGSVVQVVLDEGKWIQVRTEDGLVGYVRRTQLEMLQ